MICIKTHEVMNKTKLRLIWAVFWVCIILPIYAMLSCITRQYWYVGTIKNVMWPCLHWFGMLNLVLTFSWPLTITMRPTSSAKHSSVLSLLMQGYFHHQIHTKTGVSLGTISKIGKKIDSTKENNPGGHPSKLWAWDKQSIIHQITSGKLDNAVQATRFINKTLNNPIHPQTVQNASKEAGLQSATKKKFQCSSRHIDRSSSILLSIMKAGVWRIGKESYGQMRLKLIILGQMGRYMCGKN